MKDARSVAIRGHWRLVALACLLVLGLAWLPPAIATGIPLNAGMVWLTRALTGEEREVSQLEAVQAEHWLRVVLSSAPQNTSAWRGLGLALAVQHRDAEATEAWHNVPGMVTELMRRGQQAFELVHYDYSAEWHRRAAMLAPTLAEPWYRVGRAYQEIDAWDNALQAYCHALQQSDWSGSNRSSLYYRAGAAYYHVGGDQSLERAWQSLETALLADRFLDVWEWSDCHFLRGMILWQQGHPVEEYVAEYETAIRIQPEHASAHAQLGMAYYARDGNLRTAEAQLREAISLRPELGWPYVMLGEVYDREGLLAEAAELYDQALQFPDVQAEAQQRLQDLRHRPGNEAQEESR